MKKNIGVKIVAILALLGIVIGIIGTGLLIIFGNSHYESSRELSPQELQRILESEGIETNTDQASEEIP